MWLTNSTDGTLSMWMAKFGSVQFSPKFHKPRTGPWVRSVKPAELWTEPNVDRTIGPVQGRGGLNSEPKVDLGKKDSTTAYCLNSGAHTFNISI